MSKQGYSKGTEKWFVWPLQRAQGYSDCIGHPIKNMLSGNLESVLYVVKCKLTDFIEIKILYKMAGSDWIQLVTPTKVILMGKSGKKKILPKGSDCTFVLYSLW